jgi:hypothetical protein
MFGQQTGFGAQASIESRLAAAGLFCGEIHCQTKAVEDADNGLTGFGVKSVYQTSDKKLDSGHGESNLCSALAALQAWACDRLREVRSGGQGQGRSSKSA